MPGSRGSSDEVQKNACGIELCDRASVFGHFLQERIPRPPLTSRLDFFSVFHRAGKGHAVSEANIAADRDTAADAGDLDAGRFDETGEIERRGIAFRIGYSSKDD